MAEDGKLYIIISDRPDAAGTGALDLETGEVTNTKERKSGLDYAKHRFYSFVESQAKQAVTYGISNIGNFTGDYVSQRKVSETVQMLNILGNVGMATLAGAKFGPVGAVAGAVIAIAGTAINAGYQEYSRYVETNKMNYNIDQLRKRSGLNVYLDGSRGTEN